MYKGKIHGESAAKFACDALSGPTLRPGSDGGMSTWIEAESAFFCLPFFGLEIFQHILQICIAEYKEWPCQFLMPIQRQKFMTAVARHFNGVNQRCLNIPLG